jgi:PTS system mannose-specific IIA component
MSAIPIGVVLVTHGAFAHSLAETATTVLAGQSMLTEVPLIPVSFGQNDGKDTYWSALTKAVDDADRGSGVLVIVDMFGGTPSNLALALLADRAVEVVTGLNLPMVLRAMQRCQTLPLHDLARDVLMYGRRNVTSSAERLAPSSATESAP